MILRTQLSIAILLIIAVKELLLKDLRLRAENGVFFVSFIDFFALLSSYVRKEKNPLKITKNTPFHARSRNGFKPP